MTLVRLLGTILPVADATMSMVPHHAQASAAQNIVMTTIAMARPAGEGGVSTLFSAAGRKASSSRPRRPRSGTILPTDSSADFMDASLQAMERGITAAGLDQGV